MLKLSYSKRYFYQSKLKWLYQMITSNGAKTLDVKDRHRIEIGKLDNLIVLDINNPFDAIRKHMYFITGNY